MDKLKPFMQFSDPLVISASGIVIVFLALILLAISIIIFSKIFAAFGIDKMVGSPGQNKNSDIDEETNAILVAAITEELRHKRGNYQIKSIRKLT